jgi:hypothetical protein
MTTTHSDLQVEFRNALRVARAAGLPDLYLHEGSRTQGIAYAVSGGGYVGQFAIGRTRAEAVKSLQGMTFAWELARRAKLKLPETNRFNIVVEGQDPAPRTIFRDPDARSETRRYQQ